jgi:hypothetical protein
VNENLIILGLWFFVIGVVVSGASTLILSYGNCVESERGSPLDKLYNSDNDGFVSLAGFILVLFCVAVVDINFLGGS